MSITSTKTQELKFHPLADFPPLPDEELAALSDDIRANGLLDPITLYQDKILDGCHRHKACLKAGIEPRFEEFKGDDAAATAFVISKNIHRRHLTAEQKRELVAKLLKAKPEASNNAIAKQAKVDDKTVAKVRGEMEARSEIPNVEKRTDTKGRKQQAKKKARVTNPVAKPVAKPTMAATTTAAKGRKQQACKGWTRERWRRHKEKKKGKPKISEARSSAPEREAAARAQQDVGPQSTGEVERLRARVDELQAEKRQLEIKTAGLESEIEELKAENADLRAKLEAVGALSDAEEVERDRKACIALFQKVTDSERELAEWEAAHPKNAPAAASEPNPEPKPGSPAKKRRGWSRERYKAFRARKRGRKNRSKLDPGDPGGSATPAAAKPKANGKGKSTSGGNNIDAQASTEARKAEFAALEAASDPGPIPECLRRAKPCAA
jgi:hypothetical protein